MFVDIHEVGGHITSLHMTRGGGREKGKREGGGVGGRRGELWLKYIY